MRNYRVLLAALIVTGCSSAPDPTFAPRQDPAAKNNPELLQCGPNESPFCQNWGGRARPRYHSCECRRTR